ncbi:MAG: hypothetical protein DYG89_51950 [Caldilinea sp. CFX5]|nr:hypothetical protein [Caldilinea sp. CFX5]
MDFITTTWLVRFGHVLGGGLWVGGYALLAVVIVPLLEKEKNAKMVAIAMNAVRLLTYTGMATIFFGLLLILRTRGWASVTRWGEWGMIITLCAIIAVALLGIGDGALRPALRHLAATGDGGRARRYAWVGFGLTILAIGLMTRALYAVT